MKISTCLFALAPFILPCVLLATTVDSAQAQILLFEDDFEDGIIDPNLWEVILPASNSTAVETGGKMVLTNRAWLISESTIAGLDGDLIVEGEIQPGSNDNWYTWLYANPTTGCCCYNSCDGLYGFHNSTGTSMQAVKNVAAAYVNGSSPSGSPLGFRVTTFAGVVTWETWELADPSNKVSIQTDYTKLAGAGERIIFYNREEYNGDRTTYLDNVKVYDNTPDCNRNGIPDDQDIADGTSADCNADGVPDECEIVDDPSLDQDGDGILDSCQCAFSNFCGSTANSTGLPAVLGWSGSASISAADLTLIASDMPPFQFGMFFYGSDEWFPIVMGDGLLCVAPPLYRIRTAVFSDSSGVASLTLDYGSQPLASGKGQVTAFSTWRFQLWYRDPTGGPAGSNTTDGLMVTFCP